MKVRISARTNRIIVKVMIAFLTIVAVLLLVFLGLQIFGKDGLLGSRENSKKPWTAEDGITVGEEDTQQWQTGWVRYRGDIYEYNEDIRTYLIMGIDKLEPVAPAENGILGGQSDALFLLVVNSREKRIELIAINRDTICDVDVYDTDGSFIATVPKQITLQHGYGDGMELSCERSVNTVSRLFYGIPIHGYAAVNMGAIPALNDAIGGVELTSLEDLQVGTWQVTQGEQINLQGMDAFYYVKYRSTKIFNSAGMRLERQKQYLKAYIDKAFAACKADITLPVTLYKTITQYLVTDISVDQVAKLAVSALQYEFDAGSIRSLEGETIATETFEEFHYDEQALYELILDVFYDPVEVEE